MSHKFDSLFYVYDVGFRWGPPDLTYPPPYSSCVSNPLELPATRTLGGVLPRQCEPTCEIPGCYICKRDRDGKLYPRFP